MKAFYLNQENEEHSTMKLMMSLSKQDAYFMITMLCCQQNPNLIFPYKGPNFLKLELLFS